MPIISENHDILTTVKGGYLCLNLKLKKGLVIHERNKGAPRQKSLVVAYQY
ncbi:hypothetical protein KKC1_22660 [Calderihabitans maritimus]|uniref:Uncharacterized protein n=1 Tax=Calderihabitans maritimus TaxID=1246530 RepID=A0A1Z5HUW8_9FIRM|nr:hypothetical protein KKC1_22660 [Calderihabitans maritimus]